MGDLEGLLRPMKETNSAHLNPGRFFYHVFHLFCSMPQTTSIIPSLFLFVSILFISDVVPADFTVTNKCNYTVWPAIFSGTAPATTFPTGFSLGKNESKTITVPSSWGGRVWGRTGCTQDSSGNFSCITGDCGSGKLECSIKMGAPPATMAEFQLNGYNIGNDFFDVSLINGFNLPLLVVPSRTNCTSSGCVADLNQACPSELRITSSDGKSTVGCMTACQVTGLSTFCCNGTNSGPGRDKCKASLYSQFFLNACPQAYTYAYDDNSNTTHSCASANYQITFCPENRTVIAGNNTQPSSGGTIPSTSPRKRPRRNRAAIIGGVVGGVLVIICLVVIVVLRIRWSKYKNIEDDEEDDYINKVPGMPLKFSYEDLRIATNDFKERLGRGGFGSVYKGVLADGTGIAVKSLEELGQGKRAFLAEVETMGSLHHFNLVRLIGFCAEKSHRLLVYEYMSNSSLDKWIFNRGQTSLLDWQTRKKIIFDIAKGLAYLHEECRQTIIHLDIKPQNILLDQNFNAKISDFGLSKLIDREMGQVQLSMRGTPGYLAPEWNQQLSRISVKVDVYSFGIVLLEVVCERRSIDYSQPESTFNLLRMLQNKGEHIVENLDGIIQSDKEEIIRMVKIGAWCLQDDPERRPLMSTVVKVLEGLMEVDSDLLYKFAHALTSSLGDNRSFLIPSVPPASVLSNPR